MSDIKFQKFLHERIAEGTPRRPYNFVYRILVEAAIRAIQENRELNPEEFAPALEKHEPEMAKSLFKAKKYQKGDLAKRAAEGFEKIYRQSIGSRASYYAMSRCIFPDFCPVYVIADSFFERLGKLDVSKLTFSIFPRSFRGVIKFPVTLYDEDGDTFDEVFVIIDESRMLQQTVGIQPGQLQLGDRRLSPDEMDSIFLNLTWISKKRNGTDNLDYKTGHITLFLPKDGSIRVRDVFKNQLSYHSKYKEDRESVAFDIYHSADSYSSVVNTLLASVAYVLTGNPDLRDFQNPIKYQSEYSQTPVKADRELSRVPIHLVNFGWKKPPLYRKGVWAVEEFERIQPCGPGLKQTKIVTVKSHVRQRRSSGETPNQPAD